ncbi:hypothetical protein MB02_11735 [Croceicoccus estronivorus]|uniref:VOC family protein n=1 Tax=Croceicoccus estronivorus TaxID=1172626 RepID=UPI000836985E|nr:VOC family protein [Croceicoccus estronivorus]OCC23302.1 hypothetical protein MB02_11735 [Croceicoccus estronivorus]
MLTNIYVIDYVLKSLEDSKDRLDKIFGSEPLWIHPDMTPGQAITAMYYQLPGNGEMMHALGLFQEGGDSIRVAHDRLFLIGIMCDDMDRTMAEISARGLSFVHPEPQRYAVGESNTLGVLHGVEIFIARHIPGGDKIAREMMFTKDGSSDFGDETQGGIFKGISGLDFAVSDMDAALDTFRAVLGTEPINTTPRTAELGVRSYHFHAPGNRKGLHEIGFFSVDDGVASGGLAGRITGFLDKHGEGVFRMDLLVTDIDAMRAVLAARGIELPAGDQPILSDIHGTDLRYVTDSQ